MGGSTVPKIFNIIAGFSPKLDKVVGIKKKKNTEGTIKR